MEVVVEVGAGLDVHKKMVVACCIDGRSTPPSISRRRFRTFRTDLEELRRWLLARGCTHVAMESTGIYWVPVYRTLEGHLKIVLGNARHMANVPGRKTDKADAEWIAELLRHGLIKPNFVPPLFFRELRQLTRARRKATDTRSSVQLRIAKILECADIKLGSVASQTFGVSGRTMLAALAKGLSDPVRLADMAKGRLRRKRNDLIEAFHGYFDVQDQQLLKSQLAIVAALDRQIAELTKLIQHKVVEHASLIANLDTIPGVDQTLAVDLLAEVGDDTSAWPTVDHYAAWTGTCPGNKESAGRRRRTRVREGNPYVKCVLTQAAVCAGKTIGTYLGSRYHSIAGRRGERVAVVAVAHEIAIAAYHIIRNRIPYRPPTPRRAPAEKERERLIKQLRKLGVEVTLTASS